MGSSRIIILVNHCCPVVFKSLNTLLILCPARVSVVQIDLQRTVDQTSLVEEAGRFEGLTGASHYSI
jgi:hypothetical protein